ncbi:Flavonol synthase [Melia azedarach]|uniref:Flavonol synthase n=1 Tax=Melia azedarach TaxID=155640 RepID=A0ACC1WQF7_MELAZ|nr:Flavonol synthase [Melia azedarach]
MEVERVQDIALKQKNANTIPEDFIRSQHEQPGITTVHGAVLEVPVIDLDDPDQAKINRSIINASQEWGMFQVVNHGIPGEVISKFFELLREEKEVYARPFDSKGIEGYGTKLQKELEGKKAWVAHLFHKIWPPTAINYQFWPNNNIPSYRAFRLQASRSDVKYIPNALVIHIGDQMQILSNGKYKSVLHRTTVNKEKTRMSWAVFIEPPQDQEVGPHPKLVNEDNPPKFKTKKFSDYAYCKFNKIPQ